MKSERAAKEIRACCNQILSVLKISSERALIFARARSKSQQSVLHFSSEHALNTDRARHLFEKVDTTKILEQIAAKININKIKN